MKITNNNSQLNRYAFFDVDGTILRLRSMLTFQDFYYRRSANIPLFGIINALRSKAWWSYNILSKRDRLVVNRKYYESFKGREKIQVQEMAQKWYEYEKKFRPQLFISSTLKVIDKHLKEGISIVLVSGSFQEILQPLADELGAQHCLGTVLEVVDGRYTGKITPPQMIGEGKAIAIRAFLEQVGARSEDCFAYGDHHTDIPMLETVGHAVAIRGDSSLTQHATLHCWEILDA